MNYYLILGEELLLVSDEKPSFGKIYDNDVKSVLEYTQYDETTCYYEKLIAGTNELPKITFSEEAYKEMKERFGWVDVEREAEIIFPYKETRTDYATEECRKIFIEGFKLCQSINKNRFSEEDMRKAIELAREGESDWQGFINPDFTRAEIIEQLRQPKRVKVEVEDELLNGGYSNDPNGHSGKRQPKISNNTIKITRLCK